MAHGIIVEFVIRLLPEVRFRVRLRSRQLMSLRIFRVNLSSKTHFSPKDIDDIRIYTVNESMNAFSITKCVYQLFLFIVPRKNIYLQTYTNNSHTNNSRGQIYSVFPRSLLLNLEFGRNTT